MYRKPRPCPVKWCKGRLSTDPQSVPAAQRATSMPRYCWQALAGAPAALNLLKNDPGSTVWLLPEPTLGG